MAKYKKTRRQHYVPKVYLKFFSRRKKNNYYISVIDKDKDSFFTVNIENIACCNYFYEVNTKTENYWEMYYSKNIESSLPSVFNNLIAGATLSQNNTNILSENAKKEMSKIILSQISRTRKSKEFYSNIENNIKLQFMNTISKESDYELSIAQKEILDKIMNNNDLIRDIELTTVNSKKLLDKGTQCLMDKIWIIYKNLNYKICPFITSDHPVVYYNILNSKTDLESNGVALNSTIIQYPINSQLLLVLYPRHIFFGKLQQFDNKIIHIKENNFVLRVDKLQYEQCYKQVYYTF